MSGTGSCRTTSSTWWIITIIIVVGAGVNAQYYRYTRRYRQASSCTYCSCNQVSVVRGHLTVDGDFTLRPDGVTGYPRLTADQCYSLCRHQLAPRYCIAANHRPNDGVCLLAGYQLQQNNQSIHFRRICQAGRRCFRQLDGWRSTFHTGRIAVPPALTVDRGSRRGRGGAGAAQRLLAVADLCRLQCERAPTCYGFDIPVSPSRLDRNGGGDGALAGVEFCPFVEFRRRQNQPFQLHIRTCWR